MITQSLFSKAYNKLNTAQKEVFEEAKNKPKCGLSIVVGFGKCHGFNTPIIMYDGTIKKVQDITVNDLLMGDDSTPRKVLSLARGEDDMYEIIPTKGDKFIVNKEHILCLKVSGRPSIVEKENRYVVKWLENLKRKEKRFEDMEDAIEYLNSINQQDIYEISVKEYLKLSNGIKRDGLKLYKVPVIFNEKLLPLDPYMIGFWLGDGTSSQPEITSQDSTVIHYFKTNLQQYKCYLQHANKYTYRINGNGTGSYGCNHFMNVLKDLNLIKNKHIPHIYKCNSRENQLKLLAGILDADGHLISRGGFEFSQCIEHEQIIDDVIYLCRSLGFSCYKNSKKTTWTYKGVKKYKKAWVIGINGEGLEEIPTLCPRKKANPRQQIKNVLVNGFKVNYIGKGNYYGFSLNGNHRYLLGDFTVTHNTFTSLTIGLNIIKETNNKMLIICSKTLISNWEHEIKKFFGDTLKYIVLHSDKIKKFDQYIIPEEIQVVITTSQVTSKYFKSNELEDNVINVTQRVIHNNIHINVNNYISPANPLIKDNTGGNVLYSTRWGCLIIDEVHQYTNIKSMACLSLIALCSHFRYVLSGTIFAEPKIEKILGYYCIINDTSFPNNLPAARTFIKSSLFRGYESSMIVRNENLAFVKPIVNEHTIVHSLSHEEELLYLSIKDILLMINRAVKRYKQMQDTDNLRMFHGYLLIMITYIRQSMISPLLPIATAMLNNVDQIDKSFLSTAILDKIEELKLSEWLNKPENILSSRLKKVLEIIEKHKNERIIIFTEFSTIVKLILSIIPDTYKTLTINSQMTLEARKYTIDRFDEEPDNIFVMTYKIGSTGLNLQSCNNMILVDLCWNAGQQTQATARILRPGTTYTELNIYYLLSNTGFEYSILEKNKSKLELSHELKTSSSKLKVTTMELEKILQLIETEKNIDILKYNREFASNTLTM